MSRHALAGRRAHLMECTACWTDWAKLSIRIGDQIDERRYYADVGLPFPVRAARCGPFKVRTESGDGEAETA